MKGDQPRTIYLKDYTPPPYRIESVDLRFELGEEQTRVRSRLTVVREQAGASALVLDGQELELQSVKLDDVVLDADRYEIEADTLKIRDMPERAVLEIENLIYPHRNTSLEGLYKSGGMFCTQCEAEGFRKITYFLDRPDVMARYTTTIVAEADRYPVLLSNGDVVEQGQLDDGYHWVRWEDPFPKPCYLFALVAGDLRWVEDHYQTQSGRTVALRIYVEPQNIDKCEHALTSLRKAMAWDEATFGLEYDLDTYMIVAVDDFNMGAMENKGLNIFNSQYILARPETATDRDFKNIENVVGHEYFHNWTGNRVTCRDWFQLSLKEGLTVFREQEFSSDMGSRTVQRIQDVRGLRAMQFPEDDGPMAHPVRPDSYVEINNFYTATVYEKGAEVVRMYQTLLGAEGFRKGLSLYLRRHDGQAVTTDDFCAAMADANGVDLAQFKRWYSQAGTPEVDVEMHYDAGEQACTLTLEQSCPPTPGQSEKEPYLIPFALGLLDDNGRDMDFELEGSGAHASEQGVLRLERPRQTFRFHNITELPVPSLLRGFSAPVKLRYEYTQEQLAFLMANDTDLFNRWEAGQRLMTQIALELLSSHRRDEPMKLPEVLVDAIGQLLNKDIGDRELQAEALMLPSEDFLAEQMEIIDVDGIHHVREFMRGELAKCLQEDLVKQLRRNEPERPYRFDADAVGRRRLRNACLGYLSGLEAPEVRDLCIEQFHGADNMTDTMGALEALNDCDCPQRTEALDAFYARWRQEPLVVNKWLSLQARSSLPGTLDRVKKLMEHEAFSIKNPNKVRSLIGAFARANPVRFHDPSGEGYAFVGERVIELDRLNPQVAARLLGAMSRWRRYDENRQALMKAQLRRVLDTPNLSKDCYEIASKSVE